jgi:polyhydroxyalkanoate synthesis regulator phasin
VTDGFRKLFLASVGAVAIGAEKSQEVVGDLVKKGELTVEQGKTLNKELSRKAKEAFDNTSDATLRSRLEAMSPEERSAYAAKVAQMSAELDSDAVKVDVEGADAPEDSAQ